MEIFPFTKMSWRTPAIEAKWEPLRKRIGSAVAFAEYEMVKRKHRRCDVYDFTPDNVLRRLKRVAQDGLFYMPILVSKSHQGYSHRHYNVDKFVDGTFIYGGLSWNKEDAILFHDAGVINLRDRTQAHLKPITIGDEVLWMNPNGIDHEITGALLGYPPCCRKFFSETWLRDRCLDPMYEMAHDVIPHGHTKVSGSPYLNRLIRYWGFNLIPFFPHSYDCPEAEKFAKTWFSLMKEHDEEAAEACLEALSMPMVWSLSNGITSVEHPLFWGSSNGYYRKDKVTVEWFPQ